MNSNAKVNISEVNIKYFLQNKIYSLICRMFDKIINSGNVFLIFLEFRNYQTLNGKKILYKYFCLIK